jgi:polar amino acid transport system permease protein
MNDAISVILSNLPYLLVGPFPDGPLGGAALTLSMATLSAVLSAVLGLGAGIGLAMTRGVSHLILLTVIGFFRAIPVLMLIFWTFFLMPVLLHIDVPGLATVVVALSLIGGAYLSHSVHAGIEAVGAGQAQAALSLGLTRWQSLRHVLLPQAIRIMAPSFINQWVTLVKDTSLAYIVGVPELAFLANQVNNRLMIYPVQIFLVVGFVYLILCTSLDALATRLLLGRANATQARAPAIPAVIAPSAE